jgi:DNA-binding Lrp family transcriptional regulator
MNADEPTSGKTTDRAWLLLKVTPTKEKEVLDQISAMDPIKEASIVYGKYDLVVKAEVENIQDFDASVVRKIRDLAGVESTLTLVSTKV